MIEQIEQPLLYRNFAIKAPLVTGLRVPGGLSFVTSGEPGRPLAR
jgi:hypothetical protein